MGKISLIIAREYISRVRKKSFILMTLLGPLLIGGFLVGAVMLGKQDDAMNKVLVSDPGGLFIKRMQASANTEFTYEKRTITAEEFKNKKYESYNLLLQIPEDPLKTATAALIYRKKPSSRVESHITIQLNNVIEQLRVADAKMDPQVYAQIKSTFVSLNVMDVEKIDEKTNPYKSTFGFMLALTIYLFIFLYGAQVMRGVIEEKTSRVVEVIVSSVTPFQLMMGKIIGIALVGLTQFIVWTGSMFLIYKFLMPSLIPSGNDMAQNIAATSNPNDLFSLLESINYPAILSVFILYFIGGYLLYASLFAAVGSAVDSEADTQQFMLPISIPLVFAYIISVMGIENPEGNAQVWSSMIPFTSPVSMMVRLGTGTVPMWQVAVSLVLLMLTFLFTTWIAAKIYRTGILMYGKKASYKELWKWMWYKG